MCVKRQTGVGVSGSHNQNVGNHHETHNYSGLTREDLVAMLEERFHHVLAKEAQVNDIFAENRKLTDEVIRQNADFRMYNEAYRKQQDKIDILTKRIESLTDELLAIKK